MKKLKKTVALLLAATLFIGGCAASTSKKAAESKDEVMNAGDKNGGVEGNMSVSEAELEPVELTMYLLGDKAKDFDTVFDKINEKMKYKINATLKVKFLNWSENETKYPLLFASGEDFDIIYTADWNFYKHQASKKGFLELTDDLLSKYAPMTAESQYEESLEQAKVNGKLYMLPMNYKELTAYVYFVRGDLMKKIGMDKIESRDDFKQYLIKAKEAEPGMIPYNTGSGFDYQFLFHRIMNEKIQDKYETLVDPIYMTYIDADDNLVNLIETPQMLETIEELKSWKDAGLWSESAFSNQTNIKESFASGKSASMLLNFNDAKGQYAKLVGDHPDWDIRVYDAMHEEKALINPFTVNGMGIFSKSKNPERALMALDLLKNDREIHDLFCFGIEGVHYKKTDDKHIELLEGATDYAYDGNCNWGIRNDKFWLTISDGIPMADEMLKKWEANSRSRKYASYNFSSDKVKNETAAISELFGAQFKLLELGFTKDAKADIESLNKQYEVAGIEVIRNEIGRQLAEYKSGMDK